MHLSVAANIVAPRLSEIARGPFINVRAENEIGAQEIERFAIAAPGPQSAVSGSFGRQPAEGVVQPLGQGLPARPVAR